MDFGVFVSVHFRNHVLLSENVQISDWKMIEVYLNALRYQETFFKFKDFCQSWQFSHRWTSFSTFLWYSRRYSILFEWTRFWRWLKTIRFVHFFLFEICFPKFVPSSKIQLTRHLTRRTIKSSYRYRLMMFKYVRKSLIAVDSSTSVIRIRVSRTANL